MGYHEAFCVCCGYTKSQTFKVVVESPRGSGRLLYPSGNEFTQITLATRPPPPKRAFCICLRCHKLNEQVGAHKDGAQKDAYVDVLFYIKQDMQGCGSFLCPYLVFPFVTEFLWLRFLHMSMCVLIYSLSFDPLDMHVYLLKWRCRARACRQWNWQRQQELRLSPHLSRVRLPHVHRHYGSGHAE